MGRKIEVEFPEAEIKILATLLEKDEPERCNALWNVLKKPVKMFCYHTLSTGQFFGADGRPPRHPVKMGTQATPIGKKRRLLCQLDPGAIAYAGGYSLKFAYGHDITEPLASSGPVVARVDKEHLGNMMKGGMSIWNAQYMTHRLATIIVRRREG